MIAKTEQLKPYLETDNEEYKELADLYNNWFIKKQKKNKASIF